jgi:hypothetical protein
LLDGELPSYQLTASGAQSATERFVGQQPIHSRREACRVSRLDEQSVFLVPHDFRNTAGPRTDDGHARGGRLNECHAQPLGQRRVHDKIEGGQDSR